MEKFKKLLSEKAKPIEGDKKDAKLEVLKDLKKQAMSMMGDKLSKVTVASDSKEGLSKGLQKAKDIISKEPEMGESQEHEDSESIEEESSEEKSSEEQESPIKEQIAQSELSEEEIDSIIQELLKKKEEAKSKLS
jgi:hypothetical protein